VRFSICFSRFSCQTARSWTIPPSVWIQEIRLGFSVSPRGLLCQHKVDISSRLTVAALCPPSLIEEGTHSPFSPFFFLHSWVFGRFEPFQPAFHSGFSPFSPAFAPRSGRFVSFFSPMGRKESSLVRSWTPLFLLLSFLSREVFPHLLISSFRNLKHLACIGLLSYSSGWLLSRRTVVLYVSFNFSSFPIFF